MENTPLDRFHADPDNWKLGVLYFSREDPRLLVPKRLRGFGFTVNFGRPFAIPFIVLILGIAAAPIDRLIGTHFSPFVLSGKVLLLLALFALASRRPSSHS